MNAVVCYQCDEEGYLIGETLAYESPREPGVYLYPYLAVETPPPRPALAGRSWRWLALEWQEVPDSIRPRRIETPPEPPSLNQVAALLGMNAADLAALIELAKRQPVPLAPETPPETEPESGDRNDDQSPEAPENTGTEPVIEPDANTDTEITP